MQAYKGGHRAATWLYVWLGCWDIKVTLEQRNRLLKEAPDSGFAAYYLGDYKRAIELLMPLAERQHPHAQYELGRCFKYGLGVQQDMDTAQAYLEKAKAQGHHDAGYFA